MKATICEVAGVLRRQIMAKSASCGLFGVPVLVMLLAQVESWISSWPVESTGGTGGNVSCVFPFIYKGISWSSCIEADTAYGQPWCGTTSDVDTNGLWGWCKLTVRAYNAPSGYTHCRFPYTYGGVEYYGCHRLSVYQAVDRIHLPICGVVADIDTFPNMTANCMEKHMAYGEKIQFVTFNVEQAVSRGKWGRCESPAVRADHPSPGTAYDDYTQAVYYGCFQSNDPGFVPYCWSDQQHDEQGDCTNLASMGRAFGSGIGNVSGVDRTPKMAIDNWHNTDEGVYSFYTSTEEPHSWWAVELSYVYNITEVGIGNVEEQNPGAGFSLFTQNSFHVHVGYYCSSVAMNRTGMGLCASQDNTTIPKGVDGSITATFTCLAPLEGQYVLIYKYNTEVESLSLTEVTVFGSFVGEIAGMPRPKRDQSGIVGGGSTESSKTFLFPGAARILDDGQLVAWSYYTQTAGDVELQLWRPTSVADQYELVYSTQVWPSSSGFHFHDVEVEAFDVRRGDLVGISFVATSPVPLFNVSCLYTELEGGSETQDPVLLYSSYEASVGAMQTFTDTGNCMDYLVQALVKYYACQSHPCLNGGRCIEVLNTLPKNSFICNCTDGYMGTFCNYDIDMCSSSPCLNDGNCTDGFGTNLTCGCPSAWEGELCQTEVNECASNPCQNGGVCMDGYDGFNCTCPSGFSGSTCQQDVDECASDPCDSGATCVDGPDGYNCTCLLGYTGVHCETGIDGCSSSPCLNGATCIDEVDQYQCTCPAGYSGDNCQIDMDECASDPCAAGSNCVNGANGYSCSCVAGYTGDLCQMEINECASEPCDHGATCTDGLDVYTCTCAAGYTDQNCQTDIDECGSVPCLNGAPCTDEVNGYTCRCLAGYTGDHCETDIDECSSDPCQNGGTCSEAVDIYSCACLARFTGVDCQIDVDECASSPCLHDAECIDIANGYECQCSVGYTGTHCETDIDECSSDPCLHGGRCLDQVGEYRCDCVPGYRGTSCQTDIDECASAPCHRGTCVDEVNRFFCKCDPEHWGKFCERSVHGCVDNPCLHGGTCLDGVLSYRCACAEDYTGFHCELEIEETEFEIIPYHWEPKEVYTFDETPPDERVSAKVIGTQMWFLVLLQFCIWLCMDIHTCHTERLRERFPRRPFVRRVKEAVRRCKSRGQNATRVP